MIESEKYNAKDKRDLERKERQHLERLGATLNKGVPTQTYPERLEKNKDIINKKQKAYREKNKDVLKVRKQKHYKKTKLVSVKNKLSIMRKTRKKFGKWAKSKTP